MALTLDRAAILAALRDSRGNVSKAASALSTSRRTLQKRMREYGIPEGRSGRPKRRLRYRGVGGRLLAYGAAGAAVGVAGALLLGGKYRGA